MNSEHSTPTNRDQWMWARKKSMSQVAPRLGTEQGDGNGAIFGRGEWFWNLWHWQCVEAAFHCMGTIDKDMSAICGAKNGAPTFKNHALSPRPVAVGWNASSILLNTLQSVMSSEMCWMFSMFLNRGSTTPVPMCCISWWPNRSC